MKTKKIRWSGFLLVFIICTLSVLVPSILVARVIKTSLNREAQADLNVSQEYEVESSQNEAQSNQVGQEKENIKAVETDRTETRKKDIEQVIQNRQEFISEMNAIPVPTEMPQQEFDDLKAKAINSEIDSLLSQYNEENPIDENLYQQIMSVSDFENDYSRLLRIINQIPYDYIWRLEEDWDRYDFTMEYIHKDQYQTPPQRTNADLSSVPLYIQWNLDWAYYPYGDLDMALAGCAPTCLSMIFSYLLQDDSLTPPRIATEAEQAGMYIIGAGSSHDIFPVMSSKYGVTCTPLSVDQTSIDQALMAGQPVILNMVPGIFTHVGHFIVVTGIKDGKWVINDPNSYTRSEQLWDPATVLAECRKAWSFSL